MPRPMMGRQIQAMLRKLQQDDCGRENCRLLNPVRPDLWCRHCLVEEVARLRNAVRTGRRSGVLHPEE